VAVRPSFAALVAAAVAAVVESARHSEQLGHANAGDRDRLSSVYRSMREDFVNATNDSWKMIDPEWRSLDEFPGDHVVSDARKAMRDRAAMANKAWRSAAELEPRFSEGGDVSIESIIDSWLSAAKIPIDPQDRHSVIYRAAKFCRKKRRVDPALAERAQQLYRIVAAHSEPLTSYKLIVPENLASHSTDVAERIQHRSGFISELVLLQDPEVLASKLLRPIRDDTPKSFVSRVQSTVLQVFSMHTIMALNLGEDTDRHGDATDFGSLDLQKEGFVAPFAAKRKEEFTASPKKTSQRMYLP
jgi:hypothetical protein